MMALSKPLQGTRFGRSTPCTAPKAAVCHAINSRREIALTLIAAPLLLGNAITSPHALAAAATDDCQLKTAKNGVQWCTITEGEGPAPVKGAMIKAHYAGKLFNSEFTGTFDSSYDRGRPLSFAVGTGQVIRGWDLGILGDDDLPPMKKNEKRRLVIPPELGYGARGAGGVIPPNATLDFVVEYLGRLGQK